MDCMAFENDGLLNLLFIPSSPKNWLKPNAFYGYFKDLYYTGSHAKG